MSDSLVPKVPTSAIKALSLFLGLTSCTPIERPHPRAEPTVASDSGIKRRKDGGLDTRGEVDGGATFDPAEEPGEATGPSEVGQVPRAPSDAGMSGPMVAAPAVLLELGGACASVTQCASGKCQDGVCCESQDCGTCYRCDRTGHCLRVLSARDPKTCDGQNFCDGTGTCVSMLGRPCSTQSECEPGFCVDGVCCAERCGVCSTCGYTAERNQDNQGRCLPVDGDDADSCSGMQSCVRGACTSSGAQQSSPTLPLNMMP